MTFKEFVALSEGPMAPPNATPDLNNLFRALGIKPKDLKGAVMSGAAVGPTGRKLQNVGVFKVGDVEGDQDIKNADITFYGTDELGPSGVEDLVKKGGHWRATKGRGREKAKGNYDWLNKVFFQAQGTGGVPPASGALPGPGGSPM